MGKNSTSWRYGERGALRHLEQLDALCGISRVLSTGAGRQEVLCHVLEVLDKEFGLRRGAITLLAPDAKEVRIEAVHDLSERKSRNVTYRIGEGVTGRVIETGKAAIITRVSREPLFLNRFERWNVTKQELSFICVPIAVGDDVVGTISVDRPFDESAALDEEAKILSLVGSMIANVMRARRETEIERQALADENLRLRQELGDGARVNGIIGNSSAMRDVVSQIERVAPTDSTVLIRGEAGTGKELVARAIHYSSPRSGGPFKRLGCVALTGSLLEDELFGHEKEAFARAIDSRKGLLEEAAGGTLFMDEIGDISLPLQAKLLRVMKERKFERAGSNVAVKTDARIIAATNLDIEKAVDEGSFRPDLYRQINVSPILVPPLRKRKDDILLLADSLVEQHSKKTGKDIRRISTAAIDLMTTYHWPGNVRELENCIERAVALSTDGVVHAHHLPPTVQTSDASDSAIDGSFKDRVHLFERELILDALKRCNGNLTATARYLKATPRIVRHRVKELGIDYKRYSSKRG